MKKPILSLTIVLLGFWYVGRVPAASSVSEMDQSDLIEVQLPSKSPFPLPSNWRDWKVLRATRAEVEKVYGQPKPSTSSTLTYENETERVDVLYSAGPCAPETGRWNVAKDIVINIDLIPTKTLLLEDLVFDKRKYIRQKWSHPHDWVTYRNHDEGIWIETTWLGDKTEEVRSIRYLPKASDKRRKCKKSCRRV